MLESDVYSRAALREGESHSGGTIRIDFYRQIVFPNAIREQRRRKGHESLLMLAMQIPNIPYIRLSKIERGEVFAKAPELQQIAAALGVEAQALLVDVDAPDFSIALWAGLRGESTRANREKEELALLLAAAFRARRAGDPALTLAVLQSRYALPAVIISRIENAVKAPDRWNAATVQAICAVLGVADAPYLGGWLRAAHASGSLAPWLAQIPGAAEREARTRSRIAALRAELDRLPAPEPVLRDPVPAQGAAPADRTVAVEGAPLPDGRIARAESEQRVTLPAGSGPRSFALRMCRPTLGATVPGHAILIVDPDRFPFHGGLAVLTEPEGVRVLVVTTDRDGHLLGHSLNPEKALVLDAVAPADLAMVTAVLLG